ncbi:hypothetical protein GCM10010361_02010 [Streptomyces olivaceiscleroticus]|uniref:Uncharacterized protein n=1 Tax=Streptomyces olivaceiscleroticus TaxID=68245 RepID=A0ABN0ZBN0_9ACTN
MTESVGFRASRCIRMRGPLPVRGGACAAVGAGQRGFGGRWFGLTTRRYVRLGKPKPATEMVRIGEPAASHHVEERIADSLPARTSATTPCGAQIRLSGSTLLAEVSG